MTTQHATKGEHSAETTCSLLYVIFISAVAAIGGFLFGFDSGVINGTVSALVMGSENRRSPCYAAVCLSLHGCKKPKLESQP